MQSEHRSKTEQKLHWEEVFSKKKAFFGEEPSDFAKKPFELIRRKEVQSVLELGRDQGWDTLFFARKDLRVTALDDAEIAA